MKRPVEAVILVDHGSRRAASNAALLDMVRVYREFSGRRVVEPAHMELAPPTIAEALAACVGQGAESVIVFPFFLSPGRHWHEDIPNLVRAAATAYPHVKTLVTAPLGVDVLLAQLIEKRISDCQRLAGSDASCSICNDPLRCRIE